MQHQRFLFFLATFILCSNLGLAQDKSVRVTVFDGTQVIPAAEPQGFTDKNYIRFNAYLVGRGAFTIGYERVLHKKHTLGIDVGLTYRDFIYEAINRESAFFSEEVTVKMGGYIEAAYKFYPKSYYDFDGAIYISPGIIHRSYNVAEEVELYASTSSTSSFKQADIGYAINDVFLRFGYVAESWVLDDVISDLYFGFGYRQISSNSYEVIDTTRGEQELKSSKETKVVPAIYLGVKIGFPF